MGRKTLILSVSVLICVFAFAGTAMGQGLSIGMDIPAGDLDVYGKKFAWELRLPLDNIKLPAHYEFILTSKYFSRDTTRFELPENSINPIEVISPKSRYLLLGTEAAMFFKILHQYGRMADTYFGVGGGMFYRYMQERTSEEQYYRKSGFIPSFYSCLGVKINMTSYLSFELRVEHRKLYETKVLILNNNSPSCCFDEVTPDYRIYSLHANLNFITRIKRFY